MRKDKVDRARIGAFRSTYEIRGLNLDRFINTVKKRGITLYDIKKYGNKRLIASVNFGDGRKFFAIAKELCYNIKKVGDSGKAYPLLAAYRALGIFIGAVIIILSACYFDGVIFSFSYSGSGSVYKREVQEYLTECGIVKYSKFSSVSLEKLEDGILADNEHLSFASCTKNGNCLEIELVLKSESVERLHGDVYSLRSDVDGVIESIKVYRGTAVVQSGQKICAGDLLVDGVAVVKEQSVKINVLCWVSIIAEKQFEFRSDSAGEEEKALVLAEREFEDLNLTDSSVITLEENGTFVYTVTLKYRHVIHVG